MIRYKCINKATGLETNRWNSDFAGDDYYEPSFGPPGTYDIVQEDMTAEIAAKVADDAAVDQAKVFLKNLKKSDLIDVDKCATAIMKIVKHLRAQ